MTGQLMADVALYPLETVLHRMLWQGSRTLIVDTDSGLGAAAASGASRAYTGFFSCLTSTIGDEGVRGLYRGFGALIAQYCVQVALLRLIRVTYTKLLQLPSPPPPQPKAPTPPPAAVARHTVRSTNDEGPSKLIERRARS